MIKKEDTTYYDSNKWKCNKSPTGIHYWIINYDTQICKYCKEKRKVETEINPFKRRNKKI